MARTRPRFILLESVAALCDSDPSTGSSNVDDLYVVLRRNGYILMSAVYDSRRHGAAQRRTRWWGLAVRVSEQNVPLSTIHEFEPLQARFFQALRRMEMEPANIADVLMQEDQCVSDKRLLAFCLGVRIPGVRGTWNLGW